MDNREDELMQEYFQSGKKLLNLNEFDANELKAYQELFNFLEVKTENKLPLNFSSNVISAIQQKREVKFQLILNILFGSLLFGFIGFFFFAFDSSAFSQIFKVFASNIWLVIFTILIILIIQILDRNKISKLLREEF